MAKETESIDKLFLELSQFTTARTERELLLIARQNERRRILRDLADWDVQGETIKEAVDKAYGFGVWDFLTEREE